MLMGNQTLLGFSCSSMQFLRLVPKEVAGEKEMIEFENNTEILGELMPKYSPSYPITPKLDILGMSILVICLFKKYYPFKMLLRFYKTAFYRV